MFSQKVTEKKFSLEVIISEKSLSNSIEAFELSAAMADTVNQLKQHIIQISQRINELLRHPEGVGCFQEVLDLCQQIDRFSLLISKQLSTKNRVGAAQVYRYIANTIKNVRDYACDVVENSSEERNQRAFKTIRLYAEQVYILRHIDVKTRLEKHLAGCRDIFHQSVQLQGLRCFISYAWPSLKQTKNEFWVQSFLKIFRNHLRLAGIDALLDIADNELGGNIYQYMQNAENSEFAILIGTPSLKEKHQASSRRAVKSELNHLSRKHDLDTEIYGRSRIFPVIIAGDLKNSIPEEYIKYSTIDDLRDRDYIASLRQYITFMFQFSGASEKQLCENEEYWNNFLCDIKNLEFNEKEDAQPERLIAFYCLEQDKLNRDPVYCQVKEENNFHANQQNLIERNKYFHGQYENILIEEQSYVVDSRLRSTRVYTLPSVIELPAQCHYYCERQALRDELNAAVFLLLTPDAKRYVAMIGPGGSGKTQELLRFYEGDTRFQHKIWLKAEKREEFYADVRNFLLQKGFDVEKASINKLKKFFIEEWLRKNPSGLLCLDNAITDDWLLSWLDIRSGWTYVITTRQPSFGGSEFIRVPVQGMQESEAYVLLEKSSGIKIDVTIEGDARQLIAHMDAIPLLIEQAGRFIYKQQEFSRMTFSAFNQSFEEKGPAILSSTPLSRLNPQDFSVEEKSLWGMFALDYEFLKAKNAAALELMVNLSYLSFQDISTSILLALAGGDVETYQCLFDLGLLKPSSREEYFSVHRTIHRMWHQYYTSLSALAEQEARVTNLMKQLTSISIEAAMLGKETERDYIIHFEALYQYIFSIGESLRSTVEYAYFLSHWLNGEYIYNGYQPKHKKGVEELDKLTRLHTKRPIKEIACLYFTVGQIKLHEKKLNEAEYYFQISIEICRTLLASQLDKALAYNLCSSYHELGRVYFAKNEEEKARQYFSLSLEKSKELYDDGPHRNIAIAYSSLGLMYKKSEPSKAQELFQQSLEHFYQLFGRRAVHKIIAMNLTELGSLKRVANKVQEAEDDLMLALDMQNKIYSTALHEDMTTTQYHLSILFSERSDLENAIRYIKLAISVQEELSKNEDRWDLCESYIVLVKVLIQQNKYSEAKEKLDKATQYMQSIWDRQRKEHKVFSSLFWAIYQSDVAFFSYLVQEGRYDLMQQDERGRTLAALATELDKLAVLQALQRYRGIDVKMHDRYGNTLLSVAANYKHQSIFSWLIKEYPESYQEVPGDTPLLWAIRYEKKQLAESLIQESGSQHIHQSNQAGFTPVLMAAITGQLSILQQLVRKGARLDGKTSLGDGIIFLALLSRVEKQRNEMLLWLSKEGLIFEDSSNQFNLSASQLQHLLKGEQAQKILHKMFRWNQEVNTAVDYGCFHAYVLQLLQNYNYSADVHHYLPLISGYVSYCHRNKDYKSSKKILQLEVRHPNSYIREQAIRSLPNVSDVDHLNTLSAVLLEEKSFIVHVAIIEWLVKFPEPNQQSIGVLERSFKFYLDGCEPLLALYTVHQMQLIERITIFGEMRRSCLESEQYMRLLDASRLRVSIYKPSLVQGIHLEQFLNSSEQIFTGDPLPDGYVNAVINLRVFADELKLDLVFDVNNTCILGIDNTFSLHLTYEKNSGRLYLYSPLLDGLPQDKDLRLELCEKILEGSMLGGQMAGGGVGLAKKEGLILIHATIETVASKGNALKAFAPLFVERVEYWRSVCAEVMQEEQALVGSSMITETAVDLPYHSLLSVPLSFDRACTLHDKYKVHQTSGNIDQAINFLEQAIALLKEDEENEAGLESLIVWQLELIDMYVILSNTTAAKAVLHEAKINTGSLLSDHELHSKISEYTARLSQVTTPLDGAEENLITSSNSSNTSAFSRLSVFSLEEKSQERSLLLEKLNVLMSEKNYKDFIKKLIEYYKDDNRESRNTKQERILFLSQHLRRLYEGNSQTTDAALLSAAHFWQAKFLFELDDVSSAATHISQCKSSIKVDLLKTRIYIVQGKTREARVIFDGIDLARDNVSSVDRVDYEELQSIVAVDFSLV